MKLDKKVAEAFSRIMKRGMMEYGCVPWSIGQFEEANDSGIVGYVVWKDPEARHTTESGDTQQEFYINEDAEVCIYNGKTFTPVVFRTKNWKNFVNPEGSEE